MRAVFFVLLLANVLYLGWTLWIDRPAVPAAAPSSHLPRLALASEARPSDAKRGDASGARGTAGAVDSSARCVSLGPFEDLDGAARAAATLSARGMEPRQRAEAGEMWEGHWVYIDGLQDAAEQARVMRLLESSGIEDAHPMPGTSGGRQVSVGLFSERERAERRARAVRRLGLEPDIGARRHSGTAYWVDTLLPDGQAGSGPAALLGPEQSGARLEMRPCPRAPAPVPAAPGEKPQAPVADPTGEAGDVRAARAGDSPATGAGGRD